MSQKQMSDNKFYVSAKFLKCFVTAMLTLMIETPGDLV